MKSLGRKFDNKAIFQNIDVLPISIFLHPDIITGGGGELCRKDGLD